MHYWEASFEINLLAGPACVCRASSANQNATQGYGLVEFGRSRVPRAEFF